MAKQTSFQSPLPTPSTCSPCCQGAPRTVSSSSGVEKEEPKRRPGRLSTKPTPAKVETKPKKATGKDESSHRKVQAKGERGAKGKQVEMATQETKDLPASNGEAENKESPGLDGAGKKEVMCD